MSGDKREKVVFGCFILIGLCLYRIGKLINKNTQPPTKGK